LSYSKGVLQNGYCFQDVLDEIKIKPAKKETEFQNRYDEYVYSIGT